jgi:hypothetical protein
MRIGYFFRVVNFRLHSLAFGLHHFGSINWQFGFGFSFPGMFVLNGIDYLILTGLGGFRSGQARIKL